MNYHQEELLVAIQEIQNNNALLIDIREDEEWRTCHIKGAVHIPFSAIQKDPINSFPLSLPQGILYVHCALGGRVEYAIKELKWGAFQKQKKVIPLYHSFKEIYNFFNKF